MKKCGRNEADLSEMPLCRKWAAVYWQLYYWTLEDLLTDSIDVALHLSMKLPQMVTAQVDTLIGSIIC